jgi:hypothetical protein
VVAWFYRLREAEDLKHGIDSIYIKTTPGGKRILRASEARSLGLVAEEVRLNCGHCKPRLSEMTVQQWEKLYGWEWLEFREPGKLATENIYTSCLSDEPPEEDPGMSLSEFLEECPECRDRVDVLLGVMTGKAFEVVS